MYINIIYKSAAKENFSSHADARVGYNFFSSCVRWREVYDNIYIKKNISRYLAVTIILYNLLNRDSLYIYTWRRGQWIKYGNFSYT